MTILVINAGSSSVKFSLYRLAPLRAVAAGMVERIARSDTTVHFRDEQGRRSSWSAAVADIRQAVELVAGLLTDPRRGGLRSKSEIAAVGHRVVHGGEEMKASVRIDEDVRRTIRSCFDLAPLHNPPNLEGIDACAGCFPGAAQVAVFDTAFHSTLPDRAYLYPLPHALYREEKIRRYGFHGTSHRYVSRRAAEKMGRPIEDLRMVTCHLGNGCSVCAVAGGCSVDTSMGFTPLEGVPMGTRSGDIDPAILFHLVRRRGYSMQRLETLLNRESGLLGLAGVGSGDMRDIEAAAALEDPGAGRALRVFAYRVRKYIGAYAFAMGGLDAVVFTAGIGENSPAVRGRICDGLEGFGIAIDPERNAAAVPGDRSVHGAGSRVQVWVVPTDEEREIALQTSEVVFGGNR